VISNEMTTIPSTLMITTTSCQPEEDKVRQPQQSQQNQTTIIPSPSLRPRSWSNHSSSHSTHSSSGSSLSTIPSHDSYDNRHSLKQQQQQQHLCNPKNLRVDAATSVTTTTLTSPSLHSRSPPISPYRHNNGRSNSSSSTLHRSTTTSEFRNNSVDAASVENRRPLTSSSSSSSRRRRQLQQQHSSPDSVSTSSLPIDGPRLTCTSTTSKSMNRATSHATATATTSALSLHELQMTLQQVITSEGGNLGHYIGTLYDQIGNIYFRQDEFDTAKINYNLALRNMMINHHLVSNSDGNKNSSNKQ
jgi:hypothetical protein